MRLLLSVFWMDGYGYFWGGVFFLLERQWLELLAGERDLVCDFFGNKFDLVGSRPRIGEYPARTKVRRRS